MFAPVVTRLRTYHVAIDDLCRRCWDTIVALPEMSEWTTAARAEREDEL